ncbi:TPA: hypothetical protein NKR04_004500 [Vibrio parahaemolyticus]|uniref:hypothetical protein n=1 Tax=Vibrio vulnificus TaxID=672 RepID=UPI00285C0DB3|nr:hypothetical protein [Vibrio vulnificus]HCH1895921.1 hypothetical protein [Vibrio parahaemolyticus]
MKIETSLVKKIRLTELEDLDPITIYLEDFERSKGKITIDCWGKSWTAFWPAMGEKTIAQFFCGCNSDYLINNLDPHLKKYEPDYDTFRNEMRQKVCEMRLDNVLSKGLARELFDVEDWEEYVTENPYEPIRNPCFIYESEFKELDFDGFDVPERLTTDFLYLRKIIKTVQSALSQDTAKAA